MEQSIFGSWDYIIMAATMIASIAIGLYFRFSGGKQKTNEVNFISHIDFLTSATVIDNLIFLTGISDG